MPSSRSPSPPSVGDRRVGSVAIVAAATLLSLATLLPEALAPLVPWTPDAAGGRTPTLGTAPGGQAEAGDAALDDGLEAGRRS